jgi:hypothetical protein
MTVTNVRPVHVFGYFGLPLFESTPDRCLNKARGFGGRRGGATTQPSLAGYEDVNDAERLCHDPTFRLIGSEKVWDRGAALTSRLQTFETGMLAEEENFAGLAGLNRALIDRAETMDSSCRTTLDMDSTEIPVYGEQEQSAYNGYFESTCYHPLLLFNRQGDCLAAKLRPGNV